LATVVPAATAIPPAATVRPAGGPDSLVVLSAGSQLVGGSPWYHGWSSRRRMTRGQARQVVRPRRSNATSLTSPPSRVSASASRCFRAKSQ
jgi:hypothetical protein